MVILKNAKYPLVNPTIPKGVHVATNIMDNLKKLTFSDQELRMFSELHMSKYMTIVKLVEGVPIQLVPMDWAQGLAKSSLL